MPRYTNKNRMAPPEEFARLMEQYGLRTDAGAAFVGELLRRDAQTVKTFYSRGIDRNYLELLQYKLQEITEFPRERE